MKAKTKAELEQELQELRPRILELEDQLVSLLQEKDQVLSKLTEKIDSLTRERNELQADKIEGGDFQVMIDEVDRLNTLVAELREANSALLERAVLAESKAKDANLIAAKKFDQARPVQGRMPNGATLPSMAELVSQINTLF